MGRPLSDYIKSTIDNRGKNPKKYYDVEKYPVIDNVLIKNTLYPDMSAVNRYIDQDTFYNFLRGYVHKNMPLITLVGNGIGNVTLAPSSDVAIIQNTIGFEVEDTLDEVFLYYLLLHKQEQVKIYNRGSGQPSIKKTDLLKMDVDIPSLDLQKLIVSILMDIDNKIETNKAINRNIYAQAVSLYERFLEENSDKVIIKKIGDIADVKGGKRLPKGVNLQAKKNEHPYIRIRDLKDSCIVQLNDDFEYVDDETQKSIERYIVSSKDVLISIVGTIGLSAMVHDSLDNANLTENCVKLTNLRGVTPEYLLLFIRSIAGQNKIAQGTVGAVQPKLPIKNIQAIEISVVESNEVATLNESIEKIFGIISTNLDENIRLVELRDTLLPRLMSGELDVSAIAV